MFKKILGAVGTLVLGVGLGFLLWLTAFDGSEILKERTALPENPQGTGSGFYYENLDDTEKIAYELITEEIEGMPEKILIPSLDDEGLSNVFEALLYDNPEYFFLSDNCKTETTRFGKCYFSPEYSMTIFEYKQNIQELESIRDIILGKIGDITDDYEKELLVHDYIVDKCEYVEKTGGTYSSAYGCLVKGKASCEGYAKAMKYLFDEIGIESYLAIGTTENENSKSQGHAWNIVKIGGNYYHIDATWDDPAGEVVNKYAYFNITDKEISETHNVEERFIGRCTKNDDNFYVKNSIYFTTYDGDTRNAIVSELAKQARLENNVMSFKMSDGESLKDAEEALFELNGIYSILLSASVITNTSISQDKVTYAVDEKHNIIVITDFIS